MPTAPGTSGAVAPSNFNPELVVGSGFLVQGKFFSWSRLPQVSVEAPPAGKSEPGGSMRKLFTIAGLAAAMLLFVGTSIAVGSADTSTDAQAIGTPDLPE